MGMTSWPGAVFRGGDKYPLRFKRSRHNLQPAHPAHHWRIEVLTVVIIAHGSLTVKETDQSHILDHESLKKGPIRRSGEGVKGGLVRS